jgi:predicted nucleic acid-binding protein
MLDSGPLGRIAHPHPNREVAEWLRRLLRDGTEVIVPEIADYEIRREMLRRHATRQIQRLDHLCSTLSYMPLTTPIIHQAASFWAALRNQGVPTAHPQALDADVILAAQAHQAGALVATENVGHLSRLVAASHWRDIR